MQTKIYACRLKDSDKLLKSSSGGAFTALSDAFLTNGDVVIASVYNYQRNLLSFRIIDDENLRDEARGSKYFQSDVNNAFQEGKTWLETHPDKKILFIGTGCQADAFRVFMENCDLSSRVITIDLICYGVVSPEIWSHYLKYKLSKNGNINKYSGLTFRDKRNGWEHSTAVLWSENHEISIKDYVRIFYENAALRKTCYKCPYTDIERNTDITIGDFWGIDKQIPDFYDPMGTSLLLIHTEKGEKLFDSIKETINYKESNSDECLQPHLEHPTGCPQNRKKFWTIYHRNGIHGAIKKYTPTPFYKKVIRKIKNVLKKQKKGRNDNYSNTIKNL